MEEQRYLEHHYAKLTKLGNQYKKIALYNEIVEDTSKRSKSLSLNCKAFRQVLWRT